MTESYDIVILGAGLAGLALAAELASPQFAHLRVLIVDKRASHGRDRSFSYWRLQPHPYTALERKQWGAWRVGVAGASPGGTVFTPSLAPVFAPSTPYCSIDADAFYASALQRIGSATHIRLQLGALASLEQNDSGAYELAVNQQAVQASLIFDARGQAPPVGAPTQHANRFEARSPLLAQHFEGWEVEVEHAVFTPDTVDLMHFTAAPSQPGMHFMYVLPYSPTRALVESTWVSPAPFTRNYPAEIEQHLRTLGAGSVTVHYKERGVLLLNPANPSNPPNREPKQSLRAQPAPNVVQLGSRGGLLRAATGYSFIETIAHCQRIAARLAERALPLPSAAELAFARAWQDRQMDALLFKVLLADWQAAPRYFAALFTQVKPARLLRFLSGSASPWDRILVIAALPKTPFLKALIRQALPARALKQGA